MNGKVRASISVDVMNHEPKAELAVFLALVENGLSSRVTAGENRGELLRHDHVVRELAVAKGPALSFASIVDVMPDWSFERQAWVGFVQNLRTGEVLQALRAPACRS